jgi:hypothetical protein
MEIIRMQQINKRVFRFVGQILVVCLVYALEICGAWSAFEPSTIAPNIDEKYFAQVYANPGKLKEAERVVHHISRSGAMNVNVAWEEGKRATCYVEVQRSALMPIAVGVVSNRRDLVVAGLKALEWGGNRKISGDPCTSKDRYHTVSMFVEGAFRAILLIRRSDLAKDQDIQNQMQKILPKLREFTNWMLAEQRNGRGVNKAFTHRYFMVGLAFAQAGEIFSDQQMKAAARSLVAEGISHQLTNGVFPERQGSDTSYQSASIEMLTRYASYFSSSGNEKNIVPALSRGIEWLLSKVSTQGELATAGNTRTGCQFTNRAGKTKDVGYEQIPPRLEYYALATGYSEAVRRAQQIRSFGKAHPVECP